MHKSGTKDKLFKKVFPDYNQREFYLILSSRKSSTNYVVREESLGNEVNQSCTALIFNLQLISKTHDQVLGWVCEAYVWANAPHTHTNTRVLFSSTYYHQSISIICWFGSPFIDNRIAQWLARVISDEIFSCQWLGTKLNRID